MAVEEFTRRMGASVFAATVELTDMVKASTTRTTKIRLSNITASCISLKSRLSNDKVAEGLYLQARSSCLLSLCEQSFHQHFIQLSISFGGYSFYANARNR